MQANDSHFLFLFTLVSFSLSLLFTQVVCNSSLIFNKWIVGCDIQSSISYHNIYMESWIGLECLMCLLLTQLFIMNFPLLGGQESKKNTNMEWLLDGDDPMEITLHHAQQN